jgi:Low affinity iron permease
MKRRSPRSDSASAPPGRAPAAQLRALVHRAGAARRRLRAARAAVRRGIELLILLLSWACLGPVFEYSDTWQLWINTPSGRRGSPRVRASANSPPRRRLGDRGRIAHPEIADVS